MKTRIKVVTDGFGYTRYYPQYRVMFFWHLFYSGETDKYYFMTLEKAQEFLEHRQKTYTKEVSYITYP